MKKSQQKKSPTQSGTATTGTTPVALACPHSPGEGMSGQRKAAAAGVWGVGILTLLVYLTSLSNGFVNWDDDLYVYANSAIRSLKPSFFAWAFTDLSAGFWHPLTWISYALDFALWGNNPTGYHLSAALLHAANSALVVLLVLRLLETAAQRTAVPWLAGSGRLLAAVSTGVLFGLHPLHVESVAWISERKDLLCALFFILSLNSYLGYARRQGEGADAGAAAGPLWRDRDYLLSGALFLCALASKTMAVTLPVVLLILDRYLLGRIGALRDLPRALVDKVPFLAGSLVISLVSIGAQKLIGAMSAMGTTTLGERLLVAARALWAYLVKMVVPLDLLPFYPFPKDASLLSPLYAGSVVLFVALCLLSLRPGAQRSAWLPAWLYYLVTLLPVLGVVKVGNFAMADRFSYLPSLGPFLLVGLAAAWGWERWGGTAVGTGVVLVTAVLALLTVKQIGVWKNSVELWSHFLSREPRSNVTAYLNRGVAWGDQKRLDLAISDFTTALAIDPRYVDALLNRGMAQVAQGNLDAGLKDYDAAIAIKPDYADAFTNRGSVYLRRNEYDRALAEYDRAIALKPKQTAPRLNRALALKRKGALDQALAEYGTVLKLQPDTVPAYLGRAELELQRGAIEKAVADYQAACALGSEVGCARALMPFVIPPSPPQPSP